MDSGCKTLFLASAADHAGHVTGLGAELGEGDHVGIVTDDRVSDAGKACAEAVLEVPGDEGHGPEGTFRMSHRIGANNWPALTAWMSGCARRARPPRPQGGTRRVQCLWYR